MRRVVNIDMKQHKALKSYCKEKNLKMGEVLNGLIDFITVNNIHPMRYLKLGDEDMFSFREELLTEIRKNRQTYVSFQRTFEKEYRKDAQLNKEFHVYNLKRILTASVKGSQKEKSMNTILQFFLVMLVESEVDGYTVQNETIPVIYQKAAAKLQRDGTYYMSDIQKVAQMIIDNYGILPSSNQNKIEN